MPVLRLLLLLALLIPLPGCATDGETAPSSSVKTGKVQRPSYVAGEYIFKVRDAQRGEQALRNALAKFNITTVKEVSPGFFLIRFETDPGLQSLQSTLTDSDVVETVQPNQRYYTQPPAQ